MLWVVEGDRRQSDLVHIETATRERRAILTEDADFVELLRDRAADRVKLPPALCHFRLDGLDRLAKATRMIDAVVEIGDFPIKFTIIVVEPSRLRQRTPR